MNQYIYTRAYGLQPLIKGFNARWVNKANNVISLQLLKPNISAGTLEILTENTFTLKNFLGLDEIYVEKKGKFSFRDVFGDFSRFKFKIDYLENYPFGSRAVNIYDRPDIRKIIDFYMSSRQNEVFDLFYTLIAGQSNKVQTFYKATEILSAVIDLGNDFPKLIDSAKNINVLPPTYSEPTSTQGPGPVQTTNTSQNQTVTTVSQSQPTAQNKYILPLALLAALYVAKKKKLI